MGDRCILGSLPKQTHENRKTLTYIHTPSGIRTHDPSDEVNADNMYVTSHNHCDWLKWVIKIPKHYYYKCYSLFLLSAIMSQWFIIIIIIIRALQSFIGPWPLSFQFLDPLHSWQDSLDGGSARRKAATYTGKRKHNKGTQYRYPCLKWDSNTRSQRSSERRQFMPWTAQPLWLAVTKT
jgi:hypothetical protein